MKKVILLALLTLSFAVSGQKKATPLPAAPSAGLAPVITSQDEYNYMVKGYRVQLESGLDAKKGYTVQDLTVVDNTSYKFDFKALVKAEGNNQRVVGIIVIADSRAWGNKYYFGIPIGNSDLMQQYNSEISKLDEPMTTAYVQSVAPMMASFLSNLVDCKTNAK